MNRIPLSERLCLEATTEVLYISTCPTESRHDQKLGSAEMDKVESLLKKGRVKFRRMTRKVNGDELDCVAINLL